MERIVSKPVAATAALLLTLLALAAVFMSQSADRVREEDTRFKGIEAEVGGLRLGLRAVNSSLSERILGTGAGVASLESDQKVLKTRVDATLTRIERLESRVESLAGSIADLEGTVKAGRCVFTRIEVEQIPDYVSGDMLIVVAYDERGIYPLAVKCGR